MNSTYNKYYIHVSVLHYQLGNWRVDANAACCLARACMARAALDVCSANRRCDAASMELPAQSEKYPGLM